MNGDFRNILISVGETSSDLGFFFEGENTETITDYSFVVNWIAFLIRHGESIEHRTLTARNQVFQGRR